MTAPWMTPHNFRRKRKTKQTKRKQAILCSVHHEASGNLVPNSQAYESLSSFTQLIKSPSVIQDVSNPLFGGTGGWQF
ncbi:hypothetical protein BS78_10G117400 [Paspalum vaginatum]|nr:hypothetical protein BS78_10G117400 [Paspalum vaginatum]